MTFTVSPWLVWAGTCLALFGAVWVMRGTWQAGRDWARELWTLWLLWRAKEPVENDPRFYGPHEDGCTCYECELPPLPPERTWEQMTAHQLPVVGMSPAERKDWQQRERNRKRRAKRVEMTYRAHYAAMGYEFPSGLLARVRELTP